MLFLNFHKPRKFSHEAIYAKCKKENINIEEGANSETFISCDDNDSRGLEDNSVFHRKFKPYMKTKVSAFHLLPLLLCVCLLCILFVLGFVILFI